MQTLISRVGSSLLIAIAFFVLPNVVLAQAPAVQPEQATVSPATIVYATKTGAKYHRAGCRSLSRSQIPMTLKDASARYTPCTICKPPITSAVESTDPIVGTPAKAAMPTPANSPAVATPAGLETPVAVKAGATDGRCQAITKKGTQCSRRAKAGSKYCWQHGG
jgi:hypothetical protein